MIDALEDFVINHEQLQDENNQAKMQLQKIKDIIARERNVEQEYYRLIKEGKEALEQE